jgi:peptidoglycan-N-acetylglucosamine deacetylase
MFLFNAPYIIKKLYSKSLVWGFQGNEKAIYLTFDDGPEPSVTPWVLETLSKYNAKATFFCLGKNAEKYPALLETIIKSGHVVGNHTYSHPNGWNTDTLLYMDDIAKCDKILNTLLFRPPYGKIKPSQLRRLKHQYKIIMWTLISGDFDPKLPKDKCLEMVLNNTCSGSIIVFHDSIKAKEKLQYVLPQFLNFFTEKGFAFLPVI